MKLKIGLFFISLFFFGIVAAQGKYSTKTGTIDFEASVPSFEEVAAKNENVSAILNTSNGEFASLALIKGFRFKVALMEEHFNENYMESTTFPKAIVKGVIDGFSASEVTAEELEYAFTGTVTMHGETQPLETKIWIKKSDSIIELRTEFTLKPEQFKIKIPKIVNNKIANEVFVKAIYSLSI